MLQAIYQKLRTSGVSGLARAVRNRLVTRFCSHPIERALDELSRQEKVVIVQVGAHVGPHPNDPLAKFILSHKGLTAILIEPVKDHFDKLRANYDHVSGVICENVAIADKDEIREFYRLDANPVEHGMPDWLDQLGSLRADRMTEIWDRYEGTPEYKAWYLAHRVAESVTCVTLESLLAKHNLNSLDLLQIDAEGYDCTILNSIDFEQIRPRFLNYERVLANPQEEKECRQRLRQAGYRLFDYHQDTFCTRHL